MKRIHRLLYPRGPAGTWTPLLVAVIVLATSAMVLAAWTSEVPQRSSANAQSQIDDKKTSDFYLKKWLEEDVVYIITTEEAAAFKKLTSNEERLHFIEQFWLRRDPTPGTPENEYRDEHYRRIAYSNERFGVSTGKPGWQTDRGRMYILYGPPDQIESHPQGEAEGRPFEDWRYWHIEGIGDDLFLKFIDQDGKGDYRLAPGNPN